MTILENRNTAVALAALIAACLTGCGSEKNAGTNADSGKVNVFVSVLPQQTVVERIGGEQVNVDTMVGAGGDPHGFSATAKQMVALGRADLYLTVGMAFEKQYLPKIRETRPDLIVESMLTGIDLMDMDPHHDHSDPNTDADNHDHDHDHGGAKDTHTWLSPALLKVMAWNTRDALTEADPDHADVYAANVAAFEKELDAVDSRIRTRLAPYKGKAFYVFHPAFAYFAETYGLEQKAVEIGGQKPSPGELADMIGEMKLAGARVIFTQPQFDDKSAKAIASQIGASVAQIDPLDSDVIGNLERIATALASGLSQ